MAKVDCNTNCWIRHPLSKKKRKKCEKKKTCACGVCGALESINPNLKEGCISACNGDNPPIDHRKWMCDEIGPEYLYSHYGVLDCGYNPVVDSIEGQLYQESEKKKEESSKLQVYIIISMIVIIALSLFFILKSKK